MPSNLFIWLLNRKQSLLVCYNSRVYRYIVVTVVGEAEGDDNGDDLYVCVGDTLPVHLIILSLKRSNSQFELEAFLCHRSKTRRV